MTKKKDEVAIRQTEEEKQRHLEAYLKGSQGLEVFCKELRELGIELPVKDAVWKHAERKHIEAAVHATFSLLGGVPGMVLWASRNQTPFYTAYMKLAPADSQVFGNTQVVINTAVPASKLDEVELDEDGALK